MPDWPLAFGVLAIALGIGLIIGSRRRERALVRVPQPLWLQFEDCHEDPVTGVVTARGHIRWGGREDKIDEFVREWMPPFEARISANGRDIDMMIANMTRTFGSRDVEWRAQDKHSYIAQRTYP